MTVVFPSPPGGGGVDAADVLLLPCPADACMTSRGTSSLKLPERATADLDAIESYIAVLESNIAAVDDPWDGCDDIAAEDLLAFFGHAMSLPDQMVSLQKGLGPTSVESLCCSSREMKLEDKDKEMRLSIASTADSLGSVGYTHSSVSSGRYSICSANSQAAPRCSFSQVDLLLPGSSPTSPRHVPSQLDRWPTHPVESCGGASLPRLVPPLQRCMKHGTDALQAPGAAGPLRPMLQKAGHISGAETHSVLEPVPSTWVQSVYGIFDSSGEAAEDASAPLHDWEEEFLRRSAMS